MLHRHPEGVIQNDIVDNTYLKKSTISLTLKSMEQEGYITRVTCADDNRKIIVKITEEGKKFDNKIRKFFLIKIFLPFGWERCEKKQRTATFAATRCYDAYLCII